MMSVCARVLGAGLLLAVGWGGTAQAVPIVLEYTGVVTGGDMPTVNVNDTITFKVFADNGGSGLTSQSWTWQDVTGMSFQAGSYAATTSGQKYGCCSDSGFTTDATGHLDSLIMKVNQDGTDTNGSPLFLGLLGGYDGTRVWGDEFGHYVLATAFPTTSNTTISLAPTPIPAALPLLASAIGGLGFVGWRRTRAKAA